MKSVYQFAPRILRSMKSDCWGEDGLSHAELASAVRVYTDAYLRELADQGFDSVWAHVVLRETVSSSLFPKVDPRQLALLNRLVARTAKHGIKVYVYLCEPRGLFADDTFWERHPEARGRAMLCSSNNKHMSGVQFGMCTSAPTVREFIEESCHNLFRGAPGLGGSFCITASEFYTHCYSHYSHEHLKPKTSLIRSMAHSPIWRPDFFHQNPIEVIYKLHHLLDEAWICPRCIQRDPSEVVAELITSIRNGVKAADPAADVIAWSWAWGIVEPHPQPKLVKQLPKDVILLTDWETCGDGKKNVAGRKYPVDEYSLSYIGPCNRFLRHLRMAKQRGMRVMAKLQVSATHELATVPYIPVPFNIAEKLRRMRTHRVDGFLGCWNMGGELSPMSKVAGKMSGLPALTPLQAVRETAAEEFGEAVADEVTAAWRHFSDAWREYPSSGRVTWYGPLNYATAFPFPLDVPEGTPDFTAGHMALPRDGDGNLAVTSYHLPIWTIPFGVPTTKKAFTLLLGKWLAGVAMLEEALKKGRTDKLLIELNLARHIALSVRSTINVLRFYTILPTWKTSKGVQRRKLVTELRQILQEEATTAERDIPLLRADPRLGFHPEAHVQLFTIQDLEHKIRILRNSIKKLL